VFTGNLLFGGRGKDKIIWKIFRLIIMQESKQKRRQRSPSVVAAQSIKLPFFYKRMKWIFRPFGGRAHSIVMRVKENCGPPAIVMLVENPYSIEVGENFYSIRAQKIPDKPGRLIFLPRKGRYGDKAL